jgi:alginate O-acetyltransferase complex protein AlgI
MLAGFVASGLVHDLVISLPAGGGYGWPTLFFAIQALGLLVERSPLGERFRLGSGAPGWLWTMLLLALPLPGLFHEPFVTRIILPFMAALGAA